MKKNGMQVAVILGLALAAAAPLAAHAQAQAAQALGIYAGGAAGQAEAFKYECDPLPSCNKKGTAYEMFAGWQFNRNFAVEVAYADLGQVSSSSGSAFDEKIRVKLSEATLVGMVHLHPRLSLFGKVGGYYAHTSKDRTLSGTHTLVKKSNSNVTFAGGLQLYVTENLALRGEGQRYMKVAGGNIGESDYTAYTLGLLWKFR